MTSEILMSPFAETIYMQKYSKDREEVWEDTVDRAVTAVGYSHIRRHMEQMSFLPGGRYLYACGRPVHNTSNCFCYRAEDSREGWSGLIGDIAQTLMMGGGVGVNYSKLRASGTPILGTGGVASGPISLMKAIDSVGSHIRQGGSRRSALLGLLHWSHPDVPAYIKCKHRTEAERELKRKDPSFYLPLEGTNISIVFDKEFRLKYEAGDEFCRKLWKDVMVSSMTTGDPGWFFTEATGGLDLSNACQPSFATLLTPNGITTMGKVKEGDLIWSGKNWTRVVKKWSTGIKPVFSFDGTNGRFVGTIDHKVISRGKRVEVGKTTYVDSSQADLPTNLVLDPQIVMDGLMLGDGGVHKASGNLRILYIGDRDTDYHTSEIAPFIGRHRPGISSEVWEIETTITAEELPRTWERKIPDRFYYGSPEVKAAFLRGLFTANGCVTAGRVSHKCTSRDVSYQILDMLSSLGIEANLAVNKPFRVNHKNGEYLSKQAYNINLYRHSHKFMELIGFIQKYKMESPLNEPGQRATSGSKIRDIIPLGEHEVFDITVEDVEHTYWTGGLLVSNCSEFRSETNGDSCNLGTVFLNKIRDKDHMAEVTKHAVKFLVRGALYTNRPTEAARQAARANNRIGLGLGGVGHWLLSRGKSYDVDSELKGLLEVYAEVSEREAKKYAIKLGLNPPKNFRAIAPNGTISILAGATGGIEPLFCKAYVRRWMVGEDWKSKVVIDPLVKEFMSKGIPTKDIYDAYDISFSQKLKFLGDIQEFVDMGISSTHNMGARGTEFNNFSLDQEYADELAKYMDKLSGFTVYPDGAIDGQPLTRLSLEEALASEHEEYAEENTCKGGVCGI
jgi:ribonucleotide reductase alpha subunit